VLTLAFLLFPLCAFVIAIYAPLRRDARLRRLTLALQEDAQLELRKQSLEASRPRGSAMSTDGPATAAAAAPAPAPALGKDGAFFCPGGYGNDMGEVEVTGTKAFEAMPASRFEVAVSLKRRMLARMRDLLRFPVRSGARRNASPLPPPSPPPPSLRSSGTVRAEQSF